MLQNLECTLNNLLILRPKVPQIVKVANPASGLKLKKCYLKSVDRDDVTLHLVER